MAQNYKIRNMLKNLFTNARFLSELPFFPKKSKKLTNYQLSKKLPFFPRKSKRPKRLTKHQILKNILLPFYDNVGISRKQHAFIEIMQKLMRLKLLIE